MRWSELIRMAGRNLVSRWGRTSLNLLGVIIGCTTLLLTAACGGGVRDTFYLMFDSSPEARRIIVSREFGAYRFIDWRKAPEEAIQVPDGISAPRRKRLQGRLARKWASEEQKKQPRSVRKPLTFEDVDTFAKLEHTKFAIPMTSIPGTIETANAKKPLHTSLGYGGHLTGGSEYLVTGSLVDEDDHDGVIINEYLAYSLGHQTDEAFRKLIGQPIQFAFETNSDGFQQTPIMSQLRWFFRDPEERILFVKAFKQILENLERFGLTEKQKALVQRLLPDEPGEAAPEPKTEVRTFKVRGVFHTAAEEKSWDMFESYMRSNAGVRASAAAVRQLSQKQFKNPEFQNVSVVVDSTRNLDAVITEFKDDNFQIVSARRVLERVDREIDRITSIVYWIAAGILFLTILGISNTLFISVLQRTPEFGIMKSLGASDGDVLCLMLFEGMICGLIGAVVAVFVSFGLAAAGKSLLEDYVVDSMHRQMDFSVVISFSPPIIGATIVGSIIVCGIASLLPAWRAARLDPVEAMRRT